MTLDPDARIRAALAPAASSPEALSRLRTRVHAGARAVRLAAVEAVVHAGFAFGALAWAAAAAFG